VKVDEAAAAYREALKERTRDRAPLVWAGTEENLAAAYCMLSHMAGRPVLDDALEAIDGALEEYRKAHSNTDIERAEDMREWILSAKSK